MRYIRIYIIIIIIIIYGSFLQKVLSVHQSKMVSVLVLDT